MMTDAVRSDEREPLVLDNLALLSMDRRVTLMDQAQAVYQCRLASSTSSEKSTLSLPTFLPNYCFN